MMRNKLKYLSCIMYGAVIGNFLLNAIERMLTPSPRPIPAPPKSMFIARVIPEQLCKRIKMLEEKHKEC